MSDETSAFLKLISEKKTIASRLSNQSGASGEETAIKLLGLTKKPLGVELKNLLSSLESKGINIHRTSFDFLMLTKNIDFGDLQSVKDNINNIIFVELKTSNQDRVEDDFSKFFFALTEKEIEAADQLGDKHKVVLLNAKTEKYIWTSVPEILKRAKSTNWQVSIQL